jgi:hygromycin-B 4-O-kinase
MSTRKVVIDINKIEDFLKINFHSDAKIISEFSGNENSRAFLFFSNGAEYVIRVDSYVHDFEKDKYAYEHFSTPTLIIPKIISLGEMEKGIFFCISKKLEGIPLDKLDEKELRDTFPQLASVLREIHLTDISKTSGYGSWDLSGNAIRKSWKESLLSLKDSKYFVWEKLFNEGIYDRGLFINSFAKISALSKYVSEERFLVHGDYGFNNILVKGNKILGVIDWALSKYGDFIYDIAWLAFWEDRLDYGHLFKKYYEGYMDLSNYEERLLCYELHVGLSSSVFLAKWGDKKGYRLAKSRLSKLI